MHHFANQLSAPFPLLAAIGARTSRIEIGTAVIDVRDENPLHLAEDAGVADLVSGGRLRQGIGPGRRSRSSTGSATSATSPRREKTLRPWLVSTRSGTPRADLVGTGSRQTAERAATRGINVTSSTLLTEDTGLLIHRLQAEQIPRFRDAGRSAGRPRAPRASVGGRIFPKASDLDRAPFGRGVVSADQVGHLDAGVARFGTTYTGEPDQLVREPAGDEAVAASRTPVAILGS